MNEHILLRACLLPGGRTEALSCPGSWRSTAPMSNKVQLYSPRTSQLKVLGIALNCCSPLWEKLLHIRPHVLAATAGKNVLSTSSVGCGDRGQGAHWDHQQRKGEFHSSNWFCVTAGPVTQHWEQALPAGAAQTRQTVAAAVLQESRSLYVAWRTVPGRMSPCKVTKRDSWSKLLGKGFPVKVHRTGKAELLKLLPAAAQSSTLQQLPCAAGSLMLSVWCRSCGDLTCSCLSCCC